MGQDELLEPTHGMQIVRGTVALSIIEEMADSMFGNLAKAVVDVGQGIMAVGGEMHADEVALLLGQGSSHASLWGINLYPAEFATPVHRVRSRHQHLPEAREPHTLGRRRGRACGRHGHRQPLGGTMLAGTMTMHAGLASGRYGAEESCLPRRCTRADCSWPGRQGSSTSSSRRTCSPGSVTRWRT
jgi:hypothetical protein